MLNACKYIAFVLDNNDNNSQENGSGSINLTMQIEHSSKILQISILILRCYFLGRFT